jgi:hypothetical protein
VIDLLSTQAFSKSKSWLILFFYTLHKSWLIPSDFASQLLLHLIEKLCEKNYWMIIILILLCVKNNK